VTFLGIAIPGLLLVLALRRWFGPLPWTVAAIAFALTLAFVPAFTTEVPVPLDEVLRGYPYRGVVGAVTPGNPLTNDTVKQILPWMQVAREELLHGRLPLWNRYQFSGYPLLGNGQSAPFAPIFLATLFVPLPGQLVAMAGLKIFTALIFGWLFLRNEGAASAAALFGSVVFAFSVFQTVYLYYPMTTVTSLLPAAAFAVRGCMRHRERRWIVLLALVTAAVAAGGHPESAVHIGIACLVLMLVPFTVILSEEARAGGSEGSPAVHDTRALTTTSGSSGARASRIGGGSFASPRPRPLAQDDRRYGTRTFRSFIAALYGLALSAPAWLPVVEQALLSVRAASLAATPHAPLNPLMTWLFLNPNGFGNPVHGNWNWIYNYSIAAPTYLGLIPLALAFSARKKRDLLLLAIAVVLFLVAMNWTFVGRALNAIPPLSLIAQDRLRFVMLFFTAWLAARVVGDRWVLLPGLVLLAAATWLLRAKWDATLGWHSASGAIALAAFLVIVAIRPRLAPVAACVAVLFELFAFNHGFNVPVRRAYYKPAMPILDKLQELSLRELSNAEPSRIVAHDWTFLPNAASQYGFEDVRGHDPMALASYATFFRQLAVDDPASDVMRVQNVDHPALAFLGVRFLLTDPSFTPSPQWQLRYEGPDGRLYESTSWQRRFFGDAAIGAITQHSPTHLTVDIDAPRETLIESSQVFAPGWRARGALSTERVHDTFLGFRVAPGKHRITVRYVPRAFVAGCAIALLALCAAVVHWRVCNASTSSSRRSS
jgi:hypothetical protein